MLKPFPYNLTYLESKMGKLDMEYDDVGTNDSSHLQSGSGINSKIDYKFASKGPQIKAALAGICEFSWLQWRCK